MLLTSTAWGRFAVARSYLALRGRVPWRLMAVLADARDRGVLRRVGAGYAFRHERLQAHLADPRGTGSTTAVGGPSATRPPAGDVTQVQAPRDPAVTGHADDHGL
jgi:hypothetical protein